MSHLPAPAVGAPSRLLGRFRSWLRDRSSPLWQPSDSGPALAGEPEQHCYGPVRVLVVDDNPVNLMVVSALMESRGFVPLLASDGAEAVALACELHFDLILMDLQMPVLDGLGATAAIRRFEASGRREAVPVVAYSSMPPGLDVLMARGLNGSLDKPCDDQNLEDCLVRWCPTYRPAPVRTACDRGASHDHNRWQPAVQSPGTQGALLRSQRT